MSTSLAFNCGTVHQRAKMLKAVRSFFEEREVTEADTPILSPSAPVDAFIDVMRVEMGHGQIGYLHTSPEYGLKKLLAKGSGDIYQLGHVFRSEEISPLHSLEFTMIEWYRVGMDFETFIHETCALIRLFLSHLPAQILSYRQALFTYAHVDYVTDDLTPHVAPFSDEAKDWDRDTQLNLLFSHLVEPHLGQECLTVITDYPASQAALAKTHLVEGVKVARRFEIYYKGIELANGFDELNNSREQKQRLEEENKKRLALGKETLPIDYEFIAAVDHLPECCGVAVGFDRLMKIRPLSQFALPEKIEDFSSDF